ncbi:MAG: hypothetical protein ABI373_05400 [Flavobacteriales bacterium]
MGNWTDDTMLTAAVATAATTSAIALLGHLENGSAVAPLNAASHMLWGEEATTEEVDARHTLPGVAITVAGVASWAGVHELMMPRERPSVPRALLTGAVTAVAAYVTDYHVVPKRFTPGFEKQLSRKAMFGVYATLAIALALGSLCRDRDQA